MKPNWHYAPLLALMALAGCGDGPYEKSGKEADRANDSVVAGDNGPGARAGRAIDNAIAAQEREVDAAVDAARDRADAIKQEGDRAKDIKKRVAEIER